MTIKQALDNQSAWIKICWAWNHSAKQNQSTFDSKLFKRWPLLAESITARQIRLLDLNKKLDPKQNNIQAFNIDAYLRVQKN